MPRRRKFFPRTGTRGTGFRRLLLYCLALLLAAILAEALLLPAVARRAVRRALHKIDPQAAFELSHVSLSRLELANVAVGNPAWLTAERIEVTYRPLAAAFGRLRTVVVHGATWTPRQLGVPLPDAGAGVPDLPLERLELRDSAVLIESAGTPMRLPVEGSLERQAGDRYHVAISAGLRDGNPVSFEWRALRGSIGALHLDGVVPLRGSEKPMVSLEIKGGELSLPAQGLKAAGIDVTAAFDGVWPVSTPGGQRLTIGSGSLGKLPLRQAELEFRLDGSGALLVERARWTIDSSTFSTDAFRVDPRDPIVATIVTAENLDLAYWLPLLTDGRATGEGRLQGRVPITWRPGTARPIALGEGSLAAVPGGGWITVDDAGQLAALLESSDPRLKSDENMQLVKERLVEALTDFHYDDLRLELVPETDGLMLRAVTSGQGRRGDPPQEIGGLTINIHDIDTVLSELLLLKSPGGIGSGRTQEGPSHD
jgi:hypothetical protein